MTKKKKSTIEVQGLIIRIEDVNKKDYISLTDIAKQREQSEPNDVIRAWIRNSNTLIFLKEWEIVHNKNFKPVQMDGFRLDAQDNSRAITAKRYIEATDAIGIQAKSGRYGGTYAHSDIAINFMYWISPKFQVWFIKEFQRLKENESLLLGETQRWTLKREVAKLNHSLVTNSIKTKLIPSTLPKNQTGIVYASNADLLNVAVFEMTAKQWKASNPKTKGNIRDNANLIDLLLIANLQVIDAHLIKWGCDYEEREQILNESVKFQRKVLSKSKVVKRLKK